MRQNKTRKKIRFLIFSSFCLFLLLFGAIKLIGWIRIKTAKIEVTLQEDLSIPFLEEKKISDMIVSINGKIINDKSINTKSIGEKTVSFEFINDDGIKVPYEFKINVIDTVEPLIWLANSYTIYVGNDIDIAEKVLCGDNEDASPNCYIEGEYDYNTPGAYPLTFKAEDKSGNIATKNFTLYVKEPKKTSSNNNTSSEETYTSFAEIYTKHKTENTKIGIDVSGWQKDIDFEKIKAAGVEFIMIKVGGTKGTDGEYYVDSKFIQNITKANEVGIEVGIYFYSYANSNKQAEKDAQWVIEQIKDYQVTLPVVFDWENWSSFNDYHLSFFNLTDMANTFLNTIKEAGYEGMLYSSKSYLEKIWLPTDFDIWLAHYTENTNYQGKYKFWQLCDDGKIDGIEGPVDIDIMYLN